MIFFFILSFCIVPNRLQGLPVGYHADGDEFFWPLSPLLIAGEEHI